MKTKENPNIKNYCSKSPECDIVETGCVQSIWKVCRLCKEEVTQDLKERVEKKSELEEDEKLESLYNGWIF